MLNKMMVLLATIALIAGLLSTQTLAQEPLQCENVYTVQAGDWLSKIAEKYYGDVLSFPRILESGRFSEPVAPGLTTIQIDKPRDFPNVISKVIS
jgi:nucleoid-associated protein YgaU